MASGFKVITPKTAAQKQKLQNLPAGNVTMIKKGKKTYYVFPDPAHNQAYVGGPKSTGPINSSAPTRSSPGEDLQDAEMYQDATMEWSLWEGGEGVWGPMGGPAPSILKRTRRVRRTDEIGEAVIRELPLRSACLPSWRVRALQ